LFKGAHYTHVVSDKKRMVMYLFNDKCNIQTSTLDSRLCVTSKSKQPEIQLFREWQQIYELLYISTVSKRTSNSLHNYLSKGTHSKTFYIKLQHVSIELIRFLKQILDLFGRNLSVHLCDLHQYF